MAFEMIDGEIWFSGPERETLRHRRADHQRTRQTGTGSRGKNIDFIQRDAGLLQRALEQTRRAQKMIPRRDLGNHAAISLMFGLRRDFAREQFVPRRTATAVSSQEVSIARMVGIVFNPPTPFITTGAPGPTKKNQR